MSDTDTSDAETLLRALIALEVARRNERPIPDDAAPTELILFNAGLSLKEISTLTGRKYETVKTTIRRARAAAK